MRKKTAADSPKWVSVCCFCFSYKQSDAFERQVTNSRRNTQSREQLRKIHMSKALNRSGSQVTETAPPSILRVERRPSFGRIRLETIQEEAEGHGQSAKDSKPASPFGSCEADFPSKASTSMAAR